MRFVFSAIVLLAVSAFGAASQNRTTVQDSKKLACEISATNEPWNPPGVMDVSIDDSDVGSFRFGPQGSESLKFESVAGKHTFSFAIDGTNISCSATFSITSSKTTFTPMMRISPNGSIICGLQ
jgi:hypothetical protein